MRPLSTRAILAALCMTSSLPMLFLEADGTEVRGGLQRSADEIDEGS